MCGIVGYIGPQSVVPVIIEGLRRLEYRGYDSAGIATAGGPEGPRPAPRTRQAPQPRSRHLRLAHPWLLRHRPYALGYPRPPDGRKRPPPPRRLRHPRRRAQRHRRKLSHPQERPHRQGPQVRLRDKPPEIIAHLIEDELNQVTHSDPTEPQERVPILPGFRRDGRGSSHEVPDANTAEAVASPKPTTQPFRWKKPSATPSKRITRAFAIGVLSRARAASLSPPAWARPPSSVSATENSSLPPTSPSYSTTPGLHFLADAAEAAILTKEGVLPHRLRRRAPSRSKSSASPGTPSRPKKPVTGHFMLQGNQRAAPSHPRHHPRSRLPRHRPRLPRKTCDITDMKSAKPPRSPSPPAAPPGTLASPASS